MKSRSRTRSDYLHTRATETILRMLTTTSTPTGGLHRMTSTALVTVLRAAGRAGVAVCLWGDPGIGKSALIHAAAEADGVPCETVIGSLREPSDFAGLPVVTDDGVRLEPPAWAKRLARGPGRLSVPRRAVDLAAGRPGRHAGRGARAAGRRPAAAPSGPGGGRGQPARAGGRWLGPDPAAGQPLPAHRLHTGRRRLDRRHDRRLLAPRRSDA